jgi:hypothetical protein
MTEEAQVEDALLAASEAGYIGIAEDQPQRAAERAFILRPGGSAATAHRALGHAPRRAVEAVGHARALKGEAG